MRTSKFMTTALVSGGLAAARFEIVKGKIVAWAQVPVPKGVRTTPQVA